MPTVSAGETVAQLRDYFALELPTSDADFCFRWLCGCALVPVLKWKLTVAIGTALANADGRTPPDENLHLQLARLPWFREGHMPVELRRTLAGKLDRRDRCTVRDALAQAFDTALAEPGSAGDMKGKKAGGHLARLIGRLPDGEFADPLLSTGLRAWRAGGFSARLHASAQRLPLWMRRWLEFPVLATVAAVILALVAALWLLSLSRSFMTPRGARTPVTLDVVNLMLTACSAPTGPDWGAPSFAAGPLRLEHPLRMVRVSNGPAFTTVLLAPDLSTALTRDGSGPLTLWSLKGDGIVTHPWTKGEPMGIGKAPDGSLHARDARESEMVFARGPAVPPPVESVRAAPAVVHVVSREGRDLTAGVRKGVIVIVDTATKAVLVRIEPGNSPLLGVARLAGGHLAVARCDPKGKVVGLRVAPVISDVPQQINVAAKPSTEVGNVTAATTVSDTSPAEDTKAGLCQVINDGIRCTVRFAEVPGWRTRGRGPMGQIRGVMLHDTSTSAKGNAPSLDMIVNGRPALGNPISSLAGPLAQILIGRDGTIYQAAAFTRRANHAGAGEWNGITTGNSSFIGIDIENDGKEPHSEAQLVSARALVRALMVAYGFDSTMVVGHKEYALPRGRKPDPFLDMDAFRLSLSEPAAQAPPSKK